MFYLILTLVVASATPNQAASPTIVKLDFPTEYRCNDAASKWKADIAASNNGSAVKLSATATCVKAS